MTIKTAIEKTIEGGWNCGVYPSHWSTEEVIDFEKNQFLLDPSFWKALGKVEGWSGTSSLYPTIVHDDEMWLVNMHRMIDALADGKTLEDYFAGL